MNLDHKRKWILSEYEERTAQDIAVELGVTANSLRYKIRRWKQAGYHRGKIGRKDKAGEWVTPPKDQQLEDDKETIMALIDSGELLTNIAKSFMVSHVTLRKALTRWGVPDHPHGREGICEANRDWIIQQIRDEQLHVWIAMKVGIGVTTLHTHLRKWRAEGLLEPGRYVSSNDKRRRKVS